MGFRQFNNKIHSHGGEWLHCQLRGNWLNGWDVSVYNCLALLTLSTTLHIGLDELGHARPPIVVMKGL